MVLVCYRHGLRASELVPIRGDELRALRWLQREQDPKSPFVFTSERGSPFTTAGLCPHGGTRW
jgi:type 1 fimbriae regulatory protein FimB/type 1 fimbriae regulatory protein FimE